MYWSISWNLLAIILICDALSNVIKSETILSLLNAIIYSLGFMCAVFAIGFMVEAVRVYA